MGFPEFRDPDAPMTLDQEIRLWDKPSDELTCPRCFSPMKTWDKKCKVCGYVEGELGGGDTDLGDLSDDDEDSDETETEPL